VADRFRFCWGLSGRGCPRTGHTKLGRFSFVRGCLQAIFLAGTFATAGACRVRAPSYRCIQNWVDLDCFSRRLLAGGLFGRRLCYCRRLSRASTLVRVHTELGRFLYEATLWPTVFDSIGFCRAGAALVLSSYGWLFRSNCPGQPMANCFKTYCDFYSLRIT